MVEAVAPRIGAGSRAGGNFQVGDHAAAAMGDAAFGNETVVKAKGAETGNVGSVALGPGRGHARAGVLDRAPQSGQKGVMQPWRRWSG